MSGTRADRFYWQCQQRLVPGLRSSQYVFAEALSTLVQGRPRWLDLGCGRRPLPAWMSDELQRPLLAREGWTVGADLDFDSLRHHTAWRDRVQSTADALPFATGTFDVVSANMVMEHIGNPGRVLQEIRRVLRPGGAFIFHTPSRHYWAIACARFIPGPLKNLSIQILEGRHEKDVFPTCYRFNDGPEIRKLAELSGFKIDRLDAVSSSAVLAVAGPLVIPELLWIRLLQSRRMSRWRSNLIGVLRTQAARRQ